MAIFPLLHFVARAQPPPAVLFDFFLLVRIKVARAKRPPHLVQVRRQSGNDRFGNLGQRMCRRAGLFPIPLRVFPNFPHRFGAWLGARHVNTLYEAFLRRNMRGERVLSNGAVCRLSKQSFAFRILWPREYENKPACPLSVAVPRSSFCSYALPLAGLVRTGYHRHRAFVKVVNTGRPQAPTRAAGRCSPPQEPSFPSR